jgi:hypothetical protein
MMMTLDKDGAIFALLKAKTLKVFFAFNEMAGIGAGSRFFCGVWFWGWSTPGRCCLQDLTRWEVCGGRLEGADRHTSKC